MLINALIARGRLSERATNSELIGMGQVLDEVLVDNSKMRRMLEEMGVLKRVYQYVFTDETGVRADGENEVIAAEFNAKNGLRQTEKEKGNCCSVSAS